MPATLLACSPHLERMAKRNGNLKLALMKWKDSISLHCWNLRFIFFLLPPPSSFLFFPFLSFPFTTATNANRVAPGFSWRDLHSPSEGKSIWVASRSLSVIAPCAASSRCLLALSSAADLACHSTANYLQRTHISISSNPFPTVDTFPLFAQADFSAIWHCLFLQVCQCTALTENSFAYLFFFPTPFLVMHSKCAWLLCMAAVVAATATVLYSFTSLFII